LSVNDLIGFRGNRSRGSSIAPVSPQRASHEKSIPPPSLVRSPQVNSYPASEQRISEVERGRICNAILPMPDGKTLCAGDSILFALAYSDPSQETCYVKGGDSVCVSLTQVTELGGTDPATGQALFRLSWRPPGQSGSSGTVDERNVKSRVPHAKA
jgi:hypothetical protein